MTGIDILAMEEVVTKHAFNDGVFWVISIIFGFIASGLFIYLVVCDGFEIEFLFSCLLLAGLGLLLGLIFGSIWSTPEKIETQYKVTISDEVKMTEFLDKYELIDQEGKIYTVREKVECVILNVHGLQWLLPLERVIVSKNKRRNLVIVIRRNVRFGRVSKESVI